MSSSSSKQEMKDKVMQQLRSAYSHIPKPVRHSGESIKTFRQAKLDKVNKPPNIPIFGSRKDVIRGKALMTTGRLMQDDLMEIDGKIVSRYASFRSRQRMEEDRKNHAGVYDRSMIEKRFKKGDERFKQRKQKRERQQIRQAEEEFRENKKVIRAISAIRDLYKKPSSSLSNVVLII